MLLLFLPQILRLQLHPALMDFYVIVGDLNSRSCAYSAGTFLTVQCPHPRTLAFKKELFTTKNKTRKYVMGGRNKSRSLRSLAWGHVKITKCDEEN